VRGVWPYLGHYARSGPATGRDIRAPGHPRAAAYGHRAIIHRSRHFHALAFALVGPAGRPEPLEGNPGPATTGAT
jgi:hypothetical protein